MKKTILSVVCVAAMGMTAFAQHEGHTHTTTTSPAATTPAKADVAGAAVKFDKDEYHFGKIKQGDKVEYAFEFESTGKEPLIITQAHGSCGCTVPEWPKQPLKKGEKGVIKVTFNSAGKMGMQDKTVTITSNAADSPKVLHIKGEIEMPATSSPTGAPGN